MLLKLASLFFCMKFFHTSDAQRENEEGYALQQPPEIPDEIFPYRNVPRVPERQDVESFYKSPGSISDPGNYFVSPEQPDNYQQPDSYQPTQPKRPLRPLSIQPFEPVRPELPQTYPLQIGEVFTQRPIKIPFTDDGKKPRNGEKLYPNVITTQPPTKTSAAMMGMPYDFQWEVRDEENNNMYNHIETSDGTVTTGEYRVLLPDGRLQIVKFVDRGRGYEAEVTYEDHPNTIF